MIRDHCKIVQQEQPRNQVDKKTPVSIVLTNLQILTETAIQTILQTRILMFTGFSGNQKTLKDLFWISHKKVIISHISFS